MSERTLGILVTAKDMASGPLRKVTGQVSTLGRVSGQVGKGVGALARNMTLLGVAAGGALIGAVGSGVRSLSELSTAQQQTAAVIASTGGKAQVTAAAIRSMAESLENVTTVDDKVVQSGENMLLTFTNIGAKAFPQATKAMVDMAIAMNNGSVEGLDLKSTAIQIGKALNDPIKGVTALRKVGVALTKDHEKQIKAFMKAGKTYEAQQIILKELETEFGNAGKAAGQDFGSDLRRVQDAGEDLTMALAKGLMPVISKAAKWLNEKLADPAVVTQIGKIGDELATGAEKLLDFVGTVDFKAIGGGLGVAKDAAVGIVSAFLSMPDWVKQAVIGGWGLNKLTGGALGGIVGELGKGLIRGVLGMNAGVVNINAGVVKGGAGGVGGAAGAAGVAKGGISGLGKGLLIAEAASLAAAVVAVQQQVASNTGAQATGVQETAAKFIAGGPSFAELNRSIAGVDEGISQINKQFGILAPLVGGDEALRKLEATRVELVRSRDQAQARALETENILRVGLGKSPLPPIVNVVVNNSVTASITSRSVTSAQEQVDRTTSRTSYSVR